MQSTPKIKLSYHEQSDRVQSVMKTRQYKDVTNRTSVWSMLEMKLNFLDLSNQVWSMMKTKQDNNVTNSIVVVYAKSKIELSGHIEPSPVCY